MADKRALRTFIDAALESYPELFPSAALTPGYVLHGSLPPSAKMPTVVRRRIKVATLAYTIMPAYVLPYMMGEQAALFLRQFGAPYWALSYVFGRDDMY